MRHVPILKIKAVSIPTAYVHIQSWAYAGLVSI